MTTATLTAAPTPSVSTLTFGSAFKAGLAGGAIAAVANLALYAAARAAGVDFLAVYDASGAVTPLKFFLPAVSSLVPSLLAGPVLFGLSKLIKRPALPFAISSGVLMVLSMGGPMNLAGASTGTKVALGLMHVVAAAAIGGTLFRRARAAES